MNLKDAAANLNQAHPEDTLHPLYTPWGELLMRSGSYDDILSEYPRPQMRRTDYHMLNGLWEYAFVPADGSSSSEDPAHFTFFSGSPAFQSSQTAGAHGVPVVPPGTFFSHGRAFPKRGKHALHSAF